jgi:hypothetical protein
MLSSSDAGLARGAGARFGATGRAVVGCDVLRRRLVRLGAARRRAACGTLRFIERFALRLADRFAVFLADVFLVDALRDFAAVFAVFRRFLAMRAPFS